MSAFGGVPVFGGDGWSSTGSGRRRELPGPLSAALVLVHTLFAFTVLGGIGLLSTAASLDAVDVRLLGQVAFAAAPGTIGWVLARRSWSGGVWVWRGLLALQAWLIVAALGNIGDGSGRGFTQLFLPILIVVFLTRRESREWFRLPDAERADRRPFSMARMIRWRRDEGQTAVEYAGLVAVVAAIIAALVVSGLGTQIFTGLQSAVCKVTGTACPAAGGNGGEEVQAGDGADGTDGEGPDGPGPADPGQEGQGDQGDQGTGGTGPGGADSGGQGTGGSDSGGQGTGGSDSGGQGTGGSVSGGPPGGNSEGNGSASQGGEGGEGGEGGQGGDGGSGGVTGGVTGGVSGEDTGASYTEETDEEKDEAAEDEPGWEEDEQAAEDGGEGGDEGCTSGFGAFFGCVGDQFKQVGQGLFVDGIWGDLTGIWDTVTDPGKAWEGLKDYGSSLGDQWSEDAKDAGEKWENGDYFDALTDWGGASWNTGVKVLDDMFVGDEVRDQWNNGEKTRAVTNVVWNVGSLFIPGYGEAKIVQKLGKLGKLGKLTENAAEAAADARKAAKAGDVDAAEKAAKEADEAADAAEEKARQSGCTLVSAPGRRVPYGGGAPGLTGSAGSGTTVLAAGGSRSPYVVLAEGGCDEEAKKQAEEARKQAEEAEKAEKEARKEESRKKVAKWKKPSWYNDLRNPRKGSKDGGDGHWKAKKAVAYWPKSEVWMRYQEQVSKVKRGKEYAVKDPRTGRDVDFDGWDSARQTYVEAKFGYSNKVRADGTLEPAQATKFVEQARRQLSAANGKPVEWNFSNKAVAEAAEEAFDEAGIDVVVKYTPWEK
ncbi:Tox-REase-5 domain-containing protein [Streptomyces luteogriseus]